MLKAVTNIINASQISTPITFPGNVTLSTGNLIMGTAGKGIDFSATSGTGTSELLADYEEGTWTPSVTAASGTITTVGSVTGRYTKVGRLTTVEFDVTITLNGTGATSVIVSGFPFVVSQNTSGSSIEYVTGVFASALALGGLSQVYLRKADGTYPATNGSRFFGSLTYSV